MICLSYPILAAVLANGFLECAIHAIVAIRRFPAANKSNRFHAKQAKTNVYKCFVKTQKSLRFANFSIHEFPVAKFRNHCLPDTMRAKFL